MRFHALTACPVAVAVENDIFCNSQGTVATFFRCGGQVQKHLCRISSGFHAKNCWNRFIFDGVIQKIKMWPLLGTHCTIWLGWHVNKQNRPTTFLKVSGRSGLNGKKESMKQSNQQIRITCRMAVNTVSVCSVKNSCLTTTTCIYNKSPHNNMEV